MRGTYKATGCAMLAALALSGEKTAASEIEWFRGNDLFKECQLNNPLCNGYIMGSIDAGEQGSCYPEGGVSGEAIDIVKQWLRDHPEKRHVSASLLVIEALKEKFPCN